MVAPGGVVSKFTVKLIATLVGFERKCRIETPATITARAPITVHLLRNFGNARGRGRVVGFCSAGWVGTDAAGAMSRDRGAKNWVARRVLDASTAASSALGSSAACA